MRDPLAEKLDHALAPGRVEVEHEGRRAVAEVEGADRFGVQVRSLEVRRAAPLPLGEAVGALPDALRALPERIVPVEVAPALGGAVLRSDPRDMREREFFEVRTDGTETSLRRLRAGREGREELPFTLTRDQLGRIVEGSSAFAVGARARRP